MKVLKIVMLISLLLIPINVVYARTITIDEIVNNYKDTETYKSLEALGSNVSLENDKNNNKLKFILKGEDAEDSILTFNYTDQYIEYVNEKQNPDYEDFLSDFGETLTLTFGYAIIFETIINLSGFSDMTFDENATLEDIYNNYDKYGIEFKTKSYDFNDESSQVSGDYILSIKMSLDTDKIKNLIEAVGIKIEDTIKKEPNDISNNDILEELKKSNFYNEISEGENSVGSFIVGKNFENLTLSTYYNGKTYNTNFILKDGVLSYWYQKLDDEDTETLSYINSNWIMEAIKAVSTLVGKPINASSLSVLDRAVNINDIYVPYYKYNENGIEFEYYNYSNNNEEKYGIKSFKMNLNDFNLETLDIKSLTSNSKIDENNNETSEDTNKVTGTTNNPKTGIISIGIVSLIFGTLSFIILNFIKKKSFN